MFATNIGRELHELAAMPPIDPSEFFFSPYNEPLAPGDCRSAPEIIADGSKVADIEGALTKGHEKHAGTSSDGPGISRSFTEIQRYGSRPSIATDDGAEPPRRIGQGLDTTVAIGMSYLPVVKKEDPGPTFTRSVSGGGKGGVSDDRFAGSEDV